MLNIKPYILSFRLRTLPLAVSTVLMGNILAVYNQSYNHLVGIFAVITTVFLQILSNVANDYGDAVSGADNEDRVGPERMVASGKISLKAMRNTVIVFSSLSLVSGILLICFGNFNVVSFENILLFLLGLAAIAAAIKYTVGKNPYGYKGFGDVFVFVFFGLAGVIGTYFLHTGTVDFWIVLPASSIGFLSVGVLNLNNLRDIDSDSKTGKNTLIVKKGSVWGKKYHVFLNTGAMFLMIVFAVFNFHHWYQWIFLLAYILLIKDLVFVYKNNDPLKLYPYLKKLAISTFLFVLLMGLPLLLLAN